MKGGLAAIMAVGAAVRQDKLRGEEALHERENRSRSLNEASGISSHLLRR